jgi:hypothetical protein
MNKSNLFRENRCAVLQKVCEPTKWHILIKYEGNVFPFLDFTIKNNNAKSLTSGESKCQVRIQNWLVPDVGLEEF